MNYEKTPMSKRDGMEEFIEYLEEKYKDLAGEDWPALEARVRERHKDFFKFYDSIGGY